MEMILIKVDSNEWNYMWEWLASHPLNDGLKDPSIAINELNNEVWKYMGSFRQGDKVVHEFKHHSHPLTGEEYTLKVSGSSNMSDDDIEVKRLVK